MGLDLLVMPLNKYLQGQFESPLERFARESGAAGKYHRLGAKPTATEEEARSFVQGLRQALIRSLRPEIRWRDEGDVVFARQFDRETWHALRAFAADQHHPVPGFAFDKRACEHPGAIAIYNGARSGYVHLIRHNDFNGLYLPCDFDEPFAMSIFDSEPVTPIIGSSTRLLKELNVLGQRLRLKRDQGDEGWTDQLDVHDPLALVKSGWTLLRYCARLSVSHKLPVIFDG